MTCPRVEEPIYGGSRTLDIRVVDVQSGRPLPGVVIYLRLPWTADDHGHAGKFEYPGVTNGEGRLLIQGLHERRYWIDAVGWGYVRHSAAAMTRYYLTPEGSRSNFAHSWFDGAHWHGSLENDPIVEELSADPSRSDTKEFRLERGRLIRGRIQDPEGRPRKGVDVEVLEEFTPWRAPSYPRIRSDGDGAFAVTVHPNAKFDLRLAGSGLLFESFHREPGDGDEPLQVTLHPASTLRGKVLDAEGKPAAGIRVFAVCPRAKGRSYKTRSREDGMYEFSSVEPGPLLLFAFAEGRGSAILHAQDLRELDLNLSPQRRLSGTLRDADGKPIVRAMVRQTFRVKCGPTWMDLSGAHSSERAEKNGETHYYRVVDVKLDTDLPHGFTDEEGRFAFDAVSHDDRTLLHAWRSSDTGHSQSYYDWATLDRPAELVFRENDDAARYLDVLEEPPENIEEALERAPRGTLHGGPEIADRILTDADRRWPDQPEILKRLINARGSLGDRDGARVVADRLLSLQPRDVDAWLIRAHTRLNCGDLAAAESAFSECVHLKPESVELIAFRAIFRAHTKNFDGAREDRAAALLKGPPSPRTGLILADVARLTGDPSAALREVEAYLNAEHYETWARTVRSEAREAAGDLRGALEDVEHILAGMPSFPDWRKPHEARRDDLRRRLSLPPSSGST